MQTVNDLAAAYLAYLRRRRDSDATAEKYAPSLRRFAGWMGETALGDVPASRIEMEYLAAWHHEFVQLYDRQPSANTQRNHIQALRSFYKWADRFDLLTDGSGALARNPMTKVESVQIRRQVKDWLRQDELDALILACVKPQEKILAAYLAFTGMRISEATSVLWRDMELDASPGSIAIGRRTKTSSGVRTIPILGELRPYIVGWRQHQQEHGLVGDGTPVLCSRYGRPLLEQQVGRILDRCAKRAGITKKVNPQALRRTFGSTLINKGVSLEAVSKLLGHSNTRITEDAYAELLPDRIVAEVMRAVG